MEGVGTRGLANLQAGETGMIVVALPWLIHFGCDCLSELYVAVFGRLTAFSSSNFFEGVPEDFLAAFADLAFDRLPSTYFVCPLVMN